MYDPKGASVVITGASSGIGRAAARPLAKSRESMPAADLPQRFIAFGSVRRTVKRRRQQGKSPEPLQGAERAGTDPPLATHRT